MNLIALLIALIVFCVIYWCVMQILGAFGVGNPIAAVVQVLFVLIFLLLLVQNLGLLSSGPVLHLR